MSRFANEILESIWKDRYSKNGETYEENLRRVADYIGSNNVEKDEFFQVMNDELFFPAGRTMSNSAIGKDLTLNNCFVSPQIKDSLVDIFNKVSLGATTHQKGGGIGYDFSQIRPKGSPTSNDAIASGVVSFMDVFNAQTATILQGGRRGANMGVLNVYSMDILEFISTKSYEESKLNHFNLSVMVDNDFINAVKNDEKIFLHFPVYDEDGQILKDASKWQYSKEVSALKIWDKIMKRAYENGEPGIFFYENLNQDNNLWYIENIVCSNPCAEYLAGTLYGNNPKTNLPLNPAEYGGACNLGSVFLHNFVVNPFTKNAKFDYDRFKNTIKTAVKFLDNVIDINNYPNDIYENYQKNFRTIGLGVTGLADMLVMLGIKYNTQQAQLFVYDLMNIFAYNVYMSSIELAKEKGSFEFLDKNKFIQSGFIQKHKKIHPEWNNVVEGIQKYGIRNGKMISIAPTGTLSLTFGNNCSSGIEPIFSLEYDRKVKIGGQSEDDVKIVPMRDFAYGQWLKTTEDNVVEKEVFVTALDMTVDEHLQILASVAFHSDMSVSKTINVPTEYSFDETKDIYLKCHSVGIKGCTIFRPNEVRQGILISPSSKEIENNQNLQRGEISKVPNDLDYKKYTLQTGCGKLYLFIGMDSTGKIFDCFTNTDGVGGCTINTQANSRLLSACLRGGVPVEHIIKQLEKSGTCPSFQYKRGKGEKLSNGKSCPSAIACVLKSIIKELPQKTEIETSQLSECPECKEKSIIVEGGCNICTSCGWSKCG